MCLQVESETASWGLVRGNILFPAQLAFVVVYEVLGHLYGFRFWNFFNDASLNAQ